MQKPGNLDGLDHDNEVHRIIEVEDDTPVIAGEKSVQQKEVDSQLEEGEISDNEFPPEIETRDPPELTIGVGQVNGQGSGPITNDV
ncbi:hypothetical protein Hanom_Chr15g01352511 [Helianthus anomalus]